MDSVKYTYFHDPITPRTVTVARMIEGNTMYLAWSVNKMNKDTVAYQRDNYEPQWYGDVFNKKTGRDIAYGRLKLKQHSMELDPDKPKIRQVVTFMLTMPSDFISDIVRRSVEERFPDALEEKESEESTSTEHEIVHT